MSPRSSEAKDADYKLFFESSSEAMILADAEGRIRDANVAALRLLGRERDELVGSVFEELFDPGDARRTSAVGELRKTGSFEGTLRVRRPDGNVFEVEVAMRREGDTVSAVLTERSEGECIREEAARFRALVENAHDFVVLADENNVALYASPAIEQIMGYTPEEFVGTVIAGYIHPDDVEAALENVAKSLLIPGPHSMEARRFRRKDGSYRWIEAVVSNRLEDSVLRGVVCNCRDVTERVEAEEKLRESEERFRGLVENAHDFVVLASEENVFLYASPPIERVMGYDPEELIGTVIAELVHPDDAEAAAANVAETLPIPGPQTLRTLRYRCKDGSYRHLEVVVNNRVDDPALRGVVCNCRDVTERVEAEERLRESEEFHRALSENALDFVVIQKPDNTISYASPSVERLLGWTPEEVVGRMGADFIHPDDLEWAWPLFHEQIANPGIGVTERVGIRYKHKDSSWRWFESACNNQLDNPTVEGLVFNCRDVTERVEAEEKLKEAEERYRTLVEQVPAATYIERNDAESSTVYVSPRIEEILGYAPEEWISEPGLWLRTIHPEDHGRVLARHLRCNETGEPFDEEYRCVAKDGREVWVRDEAVLVRDPDGEPLHWQGVKADITGRKLAELEILRLNTELRAEISGYTAELKAAIESLKVGERYLKEREEQFHATFELAGVGIAHVSPEGRWLRVNGKLSEILGYERKELLARTFQDITHPEDLGTDLIHVERLLAGDIATYSSEKRYIKKDSTVVWASLTVSLVRGVGGEPKYFISVIEDITRRKRAEALLKSLTPGEIDVLGEMVRGRTNSEIAEELAFSVDTIKARVKSVIEKLGVADRTQAAVSAAETGLFDGSVNETVGESPHASRNGATG